MVSSKFQVDEEAFIRPPPAKKQRIWIIAFRKSCSENGSMPSGEQAILRRSSHNGGKGK